MMMLNKDTTYDCKKVIVELFSMLRNTSYVLLSEVNNCFYSELAVPDAYTNTQTNYIQRNDNN